MIASFFGYIVIYGKYDPHHTQFEKDLMLFITKELVFFSFVESLFLRRLIYEVESSCKLSIKASINEWYFIKVN